MKQVSRIFQGLRTLISWLRRNNNSFRFPNLLLQSFPTFALVPISLPSLVIPKQLLMLQLIRIGGVFQLPDTFRSGKRREKKPSARKKRETPTVKPHELIKNLFSATQIELSGLQRLVESASVQPMNIPVPVTPRESIAEGFKSRRYPLESMTWLRPFGHHEQVGTRLSRLADHSNEPETAGDKQEAEYRGLAQESSETGLLEGASRDKKKSMFIGSEDLTANSALPIFLESKGMGDFFGIHDIPLFLVPLRGVNVTAELEPITIPVPSTASPTRSVKRRGALSSPSVREMQRFSAGRKSEYFESGSEQPTIISHVPDMQHSHDPIGRSESKNYAVWTEDRSPISSLLDGSIGSTSKVLASISVPIMFPSRAKDRRQSWKEVIDSPSKNDTSSTLFPQFQDSRPRAPLYAGDQDYSAAQGGVESSMAEVDSTSSLLHRYGMPSLIDIPLLAPYPAFSKLDWQKVVPIAKRTSDLVSMLSMPASLKTILGASERENIVAAGKDFDDLPHWKLPPAYPLQLNVPPGPLGVNRNLAHGSSTIDVLKGLLPMTSLALVRIRAIDLNSRVPRESGPFGSLRQTWIPGSRKTRRGGSAEFDMLPGRSISPYLSPSIAATTLGQTENRWGFVHAGSQAESRYEITPIPIRSMRQRSKLDIFDSIADNLSINYPMSAELMIDGHAEIPSDRSSLRRADLDVRNPGEAGHNDLDLEELRSIRRSVHIIMNEQLRKYGFEI